MTLYQLGLEIADEGGWEEFHQRCHNYTMRDHHKARRLKLMAEYKRRKALERSQQPSLPLDGTEKSSLDP